MRITSPPADHQPAAGLAAGGRPAQKTQLLVYTALETDQLKAYQEGFNKVYPDIELKWVRDSTGVITAKLLAEKANPQADAVMGVAASSLALLEQERHARAVCAAEPRRDHEPVPRQEESAGLVRHGRLGRDGLLQHRRGGQARHPQARDLEGPDQARLQGPDRDAQPGLVGHRLLRRDRLAHAVGRQRRQGRRLEVHGRAAREHRPVHALRAPSPATWPPPASTWSASRSSTAPTANKAKGAPIDLVFPKEGLGWDLEAFAIHKGTKKLDAAKKLADWASSKDAMLLYGKNFAITAQPGVAAPLANVPKDYEARLVKMDFELGRRQPRTRSSPSGPSATTRSPRSADATVPAARRAAPRPSPRGSVAYRGTNPAPFLRLAGIRKDFGGFTALQGVDLDIAQGRVRLLPGPVGLRQDHAAAHHRRARGADRRPHRAGRARHLDAAAGAARLRHRLPVVRAVPQPHAWPTTWPMAWSIARCRGPRRAPA